MTVFLHQNFKKAYKKRPPSVRKRFDEQLVLFSKDPFDQKLKNHPLYGKWTGYRSINVTGDFRAVFKQQAEVATFVDLDTHHNLYGR
jgi:addiction module RelE/StbE family toxin